MSDNKKKYEVELKLEIKKNGDEFKIPAAKDFPLLDLPRKIKNIFIQYPPDTYMIQQDTYYEHQQLSLASRDVVLRKRVSRTYLNAGSGWDYAGEKSFLT